MDVTRAKKRKPELPVDYNGAPIQVFMAGGKTISPTGTFRCETTLIRVVNTGDSVAKMTLSNPEGGDVGMSLPAGSVEYFGVKEGDQFTVTGTIEVTFVRDQSR